MKENGSPPGAVLDERQVAEPDFLAVGQRDFRVGPVALVAGDAVAGVADVEHEDVAPARSTLTGTPAMPSRMTLRLEGFLAGDIDGEDHAAPAGAGLFVAVDADDGAEGLAGTGKVDDDLADGVAVKPARVRLVGDDHGLLAAAIASDGVVVGQHGQADGLRGRRRGIQVGFDPRIAIGQFGGIDRRGQRQ